MNRAAPPASRTPAPPDPKRRVTLLASVALVVIGVILLAFPSDPRVAYERLEKDPLRAAEWVVQGNAVYRINISRQEISVTATPVRGGLPSTLYKLARQSMVPMEARFIGDEAWLLVRPLILKDGTQLGGMMSSDMAPDAKRGYGDYMSRFDPNEFLLSPSEKQKEDSKERRIRPIHYYTQEAAPTLYRISLRDGTVRTTSLNVSGYMLDNVTRCLAPTGLYWVRPGSDSVADVQRPEGSFTERAPKDTVMLSPLDGGAPRELYSEISLTTLMPFEDGVCGRQPSVYPKIRHDLYLISPTKNTVVKNYEGFEAPVLMRGRLYWAENDREGRDESGPNTRIVSSLPNGGDRQTVIRLESPPDNPRYMLSLFANQERLYAILVNQIRNRRSQVSDRPTPEFRDSPTLVPVNPTSAEPLGDPLRLPESIKFSRIHTVPTYLYFYLVERRNNPIDVLFERVMQRAQITLCRLALPQV